MENTLAYADTFFFIASIGFIITFVLLIVALIYLIKLFKSAHAIAEKIEAEAETIGEEAKDFIFDLRDSPVFSFILGTKRPRKVASKKEKGV